MSIRLNALFSLPLGYVARTTICLLTVLLISSSLSAQNTYPWPASGNIGIGTTSASSNLQISGNAEIGDSQDPTKYGFLQLTRPLNQGDNKFHLSFVRNGNSIAGMGYALNSNVLGIWQANTNQAAPLIAMTTNQKVGIGTSTPANRLTIAGTQGDIHIGDALFGQGYNGIWLNGSTNGLDYNFISKATDNNLYINRPAGAGIYFRQSNQDQVIIAPNGNMGIGTMSPQGKLAVNGDIFAKKVKVTQTGWPDYVFEHDYPLPPLAQVERYVRENKHLPNVPSAASVEKEGLDLGDTQAVLLKKIEELTLYILQLNKRIADLEAQQKPSKK